MAQLERILCQSATLVCLFLIWFIIYALMSSNSTFYTCHAETLKLIHFIEFSSFICSVCALIDLPLKYFASNRKGKEGSQTAKSWRVALLTIWISFVAIAWTWDILVLYRGYSCQIPPEQYMTVATAILPAVFALLMCIGYCCKSSWLGFGEDSKDQSRKDHDYEEPLLHKRRKKRTRRPSTQSNNSSRTPRKHRIPSTNASP